jgi:RNA polymerase sigma-70 factor, ECF subfamily
MRAGNAGDRDAYERLLREVAPVLTRMARRIVVYAPPSVEVEDIVQEALLAMHIKRHTWKMTEPLGPWLTTILRHKAIDVVRRNGRHIHLALEDFENLLVEETSEKDLSRRDLERHLHLLSESQRQIVQSLAFNGASVRDTALRHGMSEGAVRVAWHRAKERLTKLVQQGVALTVGNGVAGTSHHFALSTAVDAKTSVVRR